eukprot:COSAG01_NODE_1286_length_10900_cov_26.719100_7_plen_77_part_00
MPLSPLLRRGRRGERTPPEDAGGDLTDAPGRGSASVVAPPALRLPQPLKRCSADKQLNQQSISPAAAACLVGQPIP